MLGGFLQCCTSAHEAPGVAEFKVVNLSSDVLEGHAQQQPVHLLTRPDSFDLTASPQRAFLGDATDRPIITTSRQESVRGRIRLPRLRRYPVPLGCSPDDPEEFRRAELLRCFQDFVMELHMGIHMTQLTTHQEYSDIHCQVLDDLQTLKVDQGCGCIVEFPLGAVSKVYRVVKADLAVSAAPFPSTSSEHVVVVEFMRRKLAFVFRDVVTAQRFLMCMELLTRSAQEQAGSGLSGACARRGGGGITPMFSASAPAMRGGRPTAPAVLKEGVA